MKSLINKRDLDILRTITSAVHESFDLDHIYNVALDLVLTLKDVDMAFIYMISEDRKDAVLQAHRNLTEAYLSKASIIPYPKGITWKLLNSGEVINVDDIQKDKEAQQVRKWGIIEGLVSLLYSKGSLWVLFG